MPRPRKCRRIDSMPNTTYFKPQGIPMTMLEEIVLHFEEVEAIRLKELEKLEQEEAAARMGISRATFQRILSSARCKVANAILTGKAIRIEGGHYELAKQDSQDE